MHGPQLLPSPRQHGPDRVHRHVRRDADLFVGASFEVIEPNDLAFAATQSLQELLDLFEALHVLRRGRCLVRLGLGEADVAAGDGVLYLLPANQFANDDPPCDHSEVRRQAGVPAEIAQHVEVLLHNLEQHFGRDVFLVLRADARTPQMRGVTDDDRSGLRKIDEVIHEPGSLFRQPGQSRSTEVNGLASGRKLREMTTLMEPRRWARGPQCNVIPFPRSSYYPVRYDRYNSRSFSVFISRRRRGTSSTEWS